MQIEDGKGSGRRAEVDEEFRLTTYSINESLESHIAATEYNAYVANSNAASGTLTVTATGGKFLYLKNLTTSNIRVSGIGVSVDTAGTLMTVVRNDVIGTIANADVHTAVNTNFGSGKTASDEILLYNWDEVDDGMTGLSGGTTIGAVILPASFVLIPAPHILTQNDSITIELKGACEASVHIRFQFH